MDSVLSPSSEEGFPYARCEAAYCGCQVIASVIGGQDESKVTHITWIGNPNQEDVHEEFADKLRELMQLTAEEREQRTAIVRQDIEQNMSLQKWVQEVLAVYEA